MEQKYLVSIYVGGITDLTKIYVGVRCNGLSVLTSITDKNLIFKKIKEGEPAEPLLEISNEMLTPFLQALVNEASKMGIYPEEHKLSKEKEELMREIINNKDINLEDLRGIIKKVVK